MLRFVCSATMNAQVSLETSAWENIGNKLNGRGDHWAYRPACTIVFADVPNSFPTIYLERRRQQTRKTNWRKQKESRLRASRNRRSARAPASCPRLQGPLRGDQPHVNISKLGPWCGRFGRAKAGMFTCRCVGAYGGYDPLSLLRLFSLSIAPARVNPD